MSDGAWFVMLLIACAWGVAVLLHPANRRKP